MLNLLSCTSRLLIILGDTEGEISEISAISSAPTKFTSNKTDVIVQTIKETSMHAFSI